MALQANDIPAKVMRNNITVTENVFKKVEQVIRAANTLDAVLRISIGGGGCSGYQYKYEVVPNNDITEEDIIFDNGITKVVIDEESQQLMSDCIIDFIEELGSSDFKIWNPKAKIKCGCGSSFSL
ncbi:HesB/IscA family protein [Candidatus Tisiphia endosymbiont of Nemotelus uliginosus]|uniref:HesB/IscA family protein n=1 Tax=Candidatus Tisiphia endosymbiont of Nemotelus uliginosus TaxID=3077926 RepID=UPI0035C8CBB5